MSNYTYSDSLCHHGIKGQKWGVRRFQNPDGSLTDAGKSHYRQKGAAENEKVVKQMKKYHRGEVALATGSMILPYAGMGLVAKKFKDLADVDPSDFDATMEAGKNVAKSMGLWYGSSVSGLIGGVVGTAMLNKKIADLELDVNSVADAKAVTTSSGPDKNASPKERAKYYEKELNNHDKWQGSMVAGNTNRKFELDTLNAKIAKKEFKKEDCSKEYAQKEKILKKMSDQVKAYEIIEKHTQELVKKLNKDKDLVYMINEHERTSDARGLYTGNYQTFKGNRYKVKTANNRRSQSTKWNTKHKRTNYTPIRTIHV